MLVAGPNSTLALQPPSPGIGDLRIDTVTRRDIMLLLDAIRDRGAAVLANRALAVTRRMFTFAVERGVIEASPFVGVRAPRDARARTLSDDEIRLLWAATAPGAPRIETSTRLALRLLLLTGARATEVCGASWDEINTVAAEWVIPAARTKNGRETPHSALRAGDGNRPGCRRPAPRGLASAGGAWRGACDDLGCSASAPAHPRLRRDGARSPPFHRYGAAASRHPARSHGSRAQPRLGQPRGRGRRSISATIGLRRSARRSTHGRAISSPWRPARQTAATSCRFLRRVWRAKTCHGAARLAPERVGFRTAPAASLPFMRSAGGAQRMPYISDAERERSRWTTLAEAVAHVEEHDGCDRPALKQLCDALGDRKLRNKFEDEKWFDCLPERASFWQQARIRIDDAKVFDADAGEWRTLLVLEDDILRLWPITNAKGRGRPVVQDKIHEAFGQLFQDGPNLKAMSQKQRAKAVNEKCGEEFDVRTVEKYFQSWLEKRQIEAQRQRELYNRF